MPLYIYACRSCGQAVERRQSFQDLPLTECEACGGELRRVLQPVGVIFRGSGFYSTDYKGAGNGSTSSDGDGASRDRASGDRASGDRDSGAPAAPAGASASEPAKESSTTPTTAGSTSSSD